MKLDKEKIKRLYLNGYNYPEIAKIFSWKPKSVQKCIQRNFKELKSVHEDKRQTRKSIEKVLRQEVNSFMSGKNCVKANLSQYKNNRNGDLVLIKNDICHTEDMPRIFRNEGIREYKKNFSL
ncbi:MAG: DNA-binding response regulator [Clostridium paraputrificum]